MHSAFKVVDSGFIFGSSWIADSLSYIPDYKVQDSGFHKNSGMRITFSYMEPGKEEKSVSPRSHKRNRLLRLRLTRISPLQHDGFHRL